MVDRAYAPHYKTGEPWQLLTETTCLACFCEEADLLSQWRAYGKNGAGYAIGFAPDLLAQAGQPMGFHLLPVIYSQKAQHDVLRAFFAEAKKVSASKDDFDQYWAQRDQPRTPQEAVPLPMPEELRRQLKSKSAAELQREREEAFWQIAIGNAAKLAMSFKSEHFSEEKEWRLISAGPVGAPLTFRALERGIAPYIEISLDHKAIVEFWLGPALDQKVNAQMLEMFIRFVYGMGPHGPRVNLSTIPLRIL